MEHNTVSNPTVSSLETKFTSLRAQFNLEHIYKYALNLGENSKLRMQATVSSTYLTAIFEGWIVSLFLSDATIMVSHKF